MSPQPFWIWEGYPEHIFAKETTLCFCCAQKNNDGNHPVLTWDLYGGTPSWWQGYLILTWEGIPPSWPGKGVPPILTWDGVPLPILTWEEGKPPPPSWPGKGVPPLVGQMGVHPGRCGRTDACENITFPIPSECGRSEHSVLRLWGLYLSVLFNLISKSHS